MKKTSWVTDLFDVYDTDMEELGAIREWKGRRYMWVKFHYGDGEDVPSKGDALGFISTGFTGYTVSSDVSYCIADWLAGGVQNETGVNTPTHGQYFWMQINGPITLSVTVEDSAAAGSGLGLGASTDGACGKATTLKGSFGTLIDASAKTAILNCYAFTYSP
jgi:hypothetical protein